MICFQTDQNQLTTVAALLLPLCWLFETSIRFKNLTHHIFNKNYKIICLQIFCTVSNGQSQITYHNHQNKPALTSISNWCKRHRYTTRWQVSSCNWRWIIEVQTTNCCPSCTYLHCIQQRILQILHLNMWKRWLQYIRNNSDAAVYLI